MESMDYPGMQAISLLNGFLLKHRNTLLTTATGSEQKHHSLARANEGVPNELLSIEKAFGGDLHAKLRRIAGMYYNLVDQEALPANVRESIEEVQAINARYKEKIAILEAIVATKSATSPALECIYANDQQLFALTDQFAPKISKKTQEEIDVINEEAIPIIKKYGETLNACATLPLHIKVSPDSKTRKTTFKADVPNRKHDFHKGLEDYCMLHTLLMSGEQKKAIVSTVKKLPELEPPSAEEDLLLDMESVFKNYLIHQPAAEGVLNAFDTELLKVAQRNVIQLQEKYGPALASNAPRIYTDFRALQQQIGLDTMPAMSRSAVEESVKPDTEIMGPTNTKRLHPHPCPHLAAKGYTVSG